LRFGIFEKHANNQKENTRRKKTNIGISTLLKNLQMAKTQTQEKKTNIGGCN